VKYGTAIVIGGSAVTLFYQYIIPAVLDYADIILPFALSNGLTAAFWMGVGEQVMGLEFVAGIATNSTIASVASWLPESIASRTIIASLLTLPAGGAMIGALTALTAPLLWSPITKLCWEPQFHSIIFGGDSLVWLVDLYYQFLIPVGLPVGIFSGQAMSPSLWLYASLIRPSHIGIALHSVLKSAVIGHSSLPWSRFTLPLLAGILALCAVVYSPKYTRGGGLEYSDFIWIQRRDHLTGQMKSLNLTTGDLQDDLRKSTRSLTLRTVVEVLVHRISLPPHRPPFLSLSLGISCDP
jgi:hypothetical protein